VSNQSNSQSSTSPRKRLILMRGLPSCGKSWTAQRIAKRESGLVLEFDSFFEQDPSGNEEKARFAWDRSRRKEARQWILSRAIAAIESGTSPIVMDDDHRPGATAKALAAHAMLHGYQVEFAEPESPWWSEIKPLLNDRKSHRTELAEWARKLSLLSRSTHNVSYSTFLARIERWDPELELLDLLAWGEDLQASTSTSTEAIS
jgi:AAA domain